MIDGIPVFDLLLPRPRSAVVTGERVHVGATFDADGRWAEGVNQGLGDLHSRGGDPVWIRNGHPALPVNAEAYVLRIQKRRPDADARLREMADRVAGSSTASRAIREHLRASVHIFAWNGAGAAHAARTLAQLVRLHGPWLPELLIADAPAFPVRGVMLDVSRCRIPTMGEFVRIVHTLAALKFNHLQLYTEHTFAYLGHREVWEGWDPITAREVRDLSALCRDHGITLAANQNTFGHMKHWLDHPRRRPLAETCGEFDFYGMRRRGPFSLCPTDPAASDLAKSLLDELVPNFLPGPVIRGFPDAARTLVNIGCDETADVGAGRSAAAVAARGKAAVYADYVAGVMRHCTERGWTPQFWADIALEHSEMLEALPAEAIPLAWGYEPDAPFSRWGELLGASGREWWICPGTSSWRSIVGRTAERRENILSAARAGVTHGAHGFMVCDWGDTGHLQQWPIALNAIAQAADAAWTGGRAGYDARAASMHAFGDGTLDLAPFLDELGDADAPIREALRDGDRARGVPPLRNASALFTAIWPARPELADPGRLAAPAEWARAGERVRTLAGRRPIVGGADARLITAEVGHTLAWAAWAARAAEFLAQPNRGPDAARQRLLREARELEEAHAGLWARRSRPASLPKSCEFWRQAADRLDRA